MVPAHIEELLLPALRAIFDRFGEWHMLPMALRAREIRAVTKGTDTEWVDRYFFDFNK